MAFWGVEVKPGKPYSHRFDASRGRLHVSQATIGISSNPQKSIVQCNVGDKSPVLLCRLIPDRTECCTLDLEFEEDDEVVFSVLGSRSVHLTGYYLGKGSRNGSGNRDGDDTDSYGEDIRDTESEQSNNSEEDEYEDDFIDDGELESPPSPMRKSKVVIEEILDDEKPVKWNVNRKRLRKTYQVSDSDSDDGKRIVVKGSTQVFDVQSEDEDDLPNSFLSKTNGQSAEVEEKSDEKVVIESKKKTEDAGDLVAGAKRNNEEFQDCETKRSELAS
ncbi:hypothetical protein IFM89_001319 [Coptis chinensis]|uniref:peptidylprolyl isomerase n=1 Tax=Coptis chinensis TaxID=261450 RepID=A0A835GUM4_9MAGN|nr:hypothetical protein IFM89_001319 [Coptis chinensis]